jgi:hypothetical protein
MTRPHLLTPAGAALCLLVALSGCASSSSSPEVDRDFGRHTRELMRSQLADPQAEQRNAERGGTTDGRAARESVNRYLDSFKAPPTSSVIAGSGGGSAN